MFSEGEILYFDPFYFKNGNTSKAKFFVILKTYSGNCYLASLPTSKDFIPEKFSIEDGCVELPEIDINCFVISSKTVITTCNKYFPLPTFIYGYQIDDYSEEYLKEIYPVEGADFERWGMMKPDIFEAMIDCFKTSKNVKRKYKTILSQK